MSLFKLWYKQSIRDWHMNRFLCSLTSPDSISMSCVCSFGENSLIYRQQQWSAQTTNKWDMLNSGRITAPSGHEVVGSLSIPDGGRPTNLNKLLWWCGVFGSQRISAVCQMKVSVKHIARRLDDDLCRLVLRLASCWAPRRGDSEQTGEMRMWTRYNGSRMCCEAPAVPHQITPPHTKPPQAGIGELFSCYLQDDSGLWKYDRLSWVHHWAVRLQQGWCAGSFF